MAVAMQPRPPEPRRCHESCLQYLAIEMVRTFQQPANGNGQSSGRSAGALEAIGEPEPRDGDERRDARLPQQ